MEEVGSLASGILRAGAIDVEVLRIGAEPPPQPLGYGLGFTADVPLHQAAAALRERGFRVSPPARGRAGGRSWRAIQVRGCCLTRSRRRRARAASRGSRRPRACSRASLPSRRPPRARPGARWSSSPEYEFDAAAWRAEAGQGPEVTAIEIGTGGHDWSALPLAPGMLELHDDGPPGVRRITFEGGVTFPAA